MRKTFTVLALALATALAAGAPAFAAGDAPLLPRELLFGNPERAAVDHQPRRHPPRLAGAGRRRDERLGRAGRRPGGRQGGHQRHEPRHPDLLLGLRQRQHILYLQDRGGDENWRVYAVDLAAGTERDLTPFEKVQARIEQVSPTSTGEILISVNDRDPQLHDVYRVNLATGERTLVQKNDGFVGFSFDDDYRVRLATRFLPDGGAEMLKAAAAGFEPFAKVPPADSLTTNPIGFDKTGNMLYLLDSRDRDTSALTKVDLTTGKSQGRLRRPAGRRRRRPRPPDREDAPGGRLDLPARGVEGARPGDRGRLRGPRQGGAAASSRSPSRTLDDKTWIVAYVRDDGPVTYYRYDRKAKKATLPVHRPPGARGQAAGADAPAGDQVARRPRAGELPDAAGRLRPRRRRRAGDAARRWCCSSTAARGRATSGATTPTTSGSPTAATPCCRVNYRGSTGFGKKLRQRRQPRVGRQDARRPDRRGRLGRRAEDRRPGQGRDHGRQLRRLRHAGRPDLHARRCSPAASTSSARRTSMTLLELDPALLGAVLSRVRAARRRSQAPKRASSSCARARRCPRSTRSSKPLLIGQGANDPRVKQAEADQIVKAMKAKKHPGDLRALPRRGPRLRAAGEPHVVQRRDRGLPRRSTSAAASSRSATTSPARA